MGVRKIIDHDQVARNRARAERLGVDGADFLFVRALDDLEERLSAVNRSFERALCIGPLADRVAARIIETGKAQAVTVYAERGLGDAETVGPDRPGGERFDLVVSLFLLHETNDTPGVLIQFQRLMTPDALLIGCLPGSGTLDELRDSLLHGEAAIRQGAATRVLPFMDVRAAGALLQRTGFAMPVTDVDEVVVRYSSMASLMADLRAMGATNTLIERSKRFAGRALFAFADNHYRKHHADDDGRLRASFQIIWFSGWSPGGNQPKPLEPGSGKVSLAEALKLPAKGD